MKYRFLKARVSGGATLSGNVSVSDHALVTGWIILKGNETIQKQAIVAKPTDIFHTTINGQTFTYTKNNDNWHTKSFDKSTKDFLASAKNPEQKRLYKQLISLAKEGTTTC